MDHWPHDDLVGPIWPPSSAILRDMLKFRDRSLQIISTVLKLHKYMNSVLVSKCISRVKPSLKLSMKLLDNERRQLLVRDILMCHEICRVHCFDKHNSYELKRLGKGKKLSKFLEYEGRLRKNQTESLNVGSYTAYWANVAAHWGNGQCIGMIGQCIGLMGQCIRLMGQCIGLIGVNKWAQCCTKMTLSIILKIIFLYFGKFEPVGFL